MLSSEGKKQPKDGSCWVNGRTAASTNDWVALKDMKYSYPVRVAEYVISNRIAEEPVFAWLVQDTVKRRDRIIAKVASKYWQKTHRYGIRVPKTVQEAIVIDKENGNTVWWDAICKEMTNMRPTAFEKMWRKRRQAPTRIPKDEVSLHIQY